MEISQFKIFEGIVHGVTQRGSNQDNYGAYNLATHTGDELEKVLRNRAALARKIGIEPKQLIFADQTHSANCVRINDTDDNFLSDTDAMVTNVPGICLNILTADCVPILLFDPINKAIGVVHAGWRGTASKLVVITVQKMKEEYCTQPKNLLIGIGPCISQKVYEVGAEVAEQFEHACLLPLENGKFKLDLVTANTNQLLEIGVDIKKIEAMYECTFSTNNYYSARRDGLKSGRFSTFIMLNH